MMLNTNARPTPTWHDLRSALRRYARLGWNPWLTEHGEILVNTGCAFDAFTLPVDDETHVRTALPTAPLFQDADLPRCTLLVARADIPIPRTGGPGHALTAGRMRALPYRTPIKLPVLGVRGVPGVSRWLNPPDGPFPSWQAALAVLTGRIGATS